MKGSCRVDMALIKDFSQIIALSLFYKCHCILPCQWASFHLKRSYWRAPALLGLRMLL